MHPALRDGWGDLAGFLPLYLRHHSFGDFSYDWSWAQFWRQLGLDLNFFFGWKCEFAGRVGKLPFVPELRLSGR